jgi:hypothetical protein
MGRNAGHALGIWICWCSLFYRIELWASKFLRVSVALKAYKSASAKGDVQKFYEFMHPLHPC